MPARATAPPSHRRASPGRIAYSRVRPIRWLAVAAYDPCVAAAEPLRVTTRSGASTFAPETPVVIGRDSSVTVHIAHEKVSRQHLTVRFEAGTGWIATDASSNGTFRDGVRVGRVVIDGSVVLMLGNPDDGERVELAVGPVPAQRKPSGAARPAAKSAPPSASTVHPVVPAAAPVQPGPGPAAGQLLGAFSMVHQTGKRTTIGRHSDNDIVVADLLASRHHAALTGDRRAAGSSKTSAASTAPSSTARGSPSAPRSPTAPSSASPTTCSS